MKRLLPLLTLAAVAAGMILALPALAGKPKPKTVKVGDYFLSPSKLTVPENTTIVWKWDAGNGDTHDVYLSKRPKGVKRFQSELATTDYRFKAKLKVAGTYTIICTLHPTDMRQKITVK